MYNECMCIVTDCVPQTEVVFPAQRIFAQTFHFSDTDMSNICAKDMIRAIVISIAFSLRIK